MRRNQQVSEGVVAPWAQPVEEAAVEVALLAVLLSFLQLWEVAQSQQEEVELEQELQLELVVLAVLEVLEVLEVLLELAQLGDLPELAKQLLALTLLLELT